MKKSSVVGKNEENKRKCKEKQVLVINSITLRKKGIDIRPKRLKDFLPHFFLPDLIFMRVAHSSIMTAEISPKSPEILFFNIMG